VQFFYIIYGIGLANAYVAQVMFLSDVHWSMMCDPAGELVHLSGQTVHDSCPSLSVYLPSSQPTHSLPVR